MEVIDGPPGLDKLEVNDYVNLSFNRNEKRRYNRGVMIYKDGRNRLHFIYGMQRMDDGITIKPIGYIRGAPNG